MFSIYPLVLLYSDDVIETILLYEFQLVFQFV